MWATPFMRKMKNKKMDTRITLIVALKLFVIANTFPGISIAGDTEKEKPISRSLMETIETRATIMTQEQPAKVPEVNLPPTINGQLAEDQWKDAAVWKLPWEINRGENRTAPARTFVLMMTSESDLHIAFINKDDHPHQIRGTLTDRDNWSERNNDAVGFYLDQYNDARNAYRIMVNASGVQSDANRIDRGAQGTEDDNSFDFLWHSEASRFDGGYIVEITIPFRYLQLPESEDNTLEMGFMPFRMQPREYNNKLAPIEWNFNRNCFLCQIPTVEIEKPGSNPSPVQFIPYASGFAEGSGEGTNLTEHPGETTGSIGIDMKYQATNSVFDATILPDFSQVETDAFEMTSNVRFMPRFQEQRPFFMERTDLFRFPISQTLYTRSIVDPTAGARWTGKTGNHNWAVMSLHDQNSWFLEPGPQTSRLRVDDEADSWNNLFRYRYDLSSDIMMGVFYSDRITEDGYNRLFSYDGQFGIGSSHTLVVQGLGAWNRYPERFADTYNVSTEQTFDYGYLLRMSRSGRDFDYRVETRRYGDDLITGTGILQQTGVQRTGLRAGYNFWLDGDYVDRIRPWIRNTTQWLLDGGNLASVLEDPEPLSVTHRQGLSIYGINQTTIRLSGIYNHELVEGTVNEEFISKNFDMYGVWGQISTNVTPDYRISLNSSYSSSVDYRLIEEMEEFNFSLSNSLFLFNRQLDLSHSLDYMRLFHDVTAQQALTQRLSAELQLTRRFAIRNITQYRNFQFKEPRYAENVPDQIRTLQNQTLLRYRINYAAAIYLGGFAELGEEAPRTLIDDTVQERSQWQVFAKVSYLF